MLLNSGFSKLYLYSLVEICLILCAILRLVTTILYIYGCSLWMFTLTNRIMRGSGQVVNGDKDIAYTHKNLPLQ